MSIFTRYQCINLDVVFVCLYIYLRSLNGFEIAIYPYLPKFFILIDLGFKSSFEKLYQ